MSQSSQLHKDLAHCHISSKGLNIHVELCAHCDLRCSFCHIPTMERVKGRMTMDVFEKVAADTAEVIKQMPEADTPPVLRLFVYGESTLHPKFVEFVELTQEYGLAIQLNTNGNRLKREHVEALAKSKLSSLIFSIDGSNAKEYESVRIGGKYAKVVENVFMARDVFQAHRRNWKGLMRIQTIRMKGFEQAARRAEVFWKSNGFLVKVRDVQTQAGTVDHELLDGDFETYACGRPYDRVVVYWDGRVGCCCSDGDGQLIYDDIRKNSMLSIVKGETRRGLLQAWERGETKFCQQCPNYWNYQGKLP